LNTEKINQIKKKSSEIVTKQIELPESLKILGFPAMPADAALVLQKMQTLVELNDPSKGGSAFLQSQIIAASKRISAALTGQESGKEEKEKEKEKYEKMRKFQEEKDDAFRRLKDFEKNLSIEEKLKRSRIISDFSFDNVFFNTKEALSSEQLEKYRITKQTWSGFNLQFEVPNTPEEQMLLKRLNELKYKSKMEIFWEKLWSIAKTFRW